MICLKKIAACVKYDMPWLETDEVLDECYLAAASLSEKDRLHYARAVICDVKKVFARRKYRESVPKGTRHIRYMRVEDNRCPESRWADGLTVRQMLTLLTDNQMQLIQDHYWNGLTFAAIGRREGIGRSVICRRHSKIIKELRHAEARVTNI